MVVEKWLGIPLVILGALIKGKTGRILILVGLLLIFLPILAISSLFASPLLIAIIVIIILAMMFGGGKKK